MGDAVFEFMEVPPVKSDSMTTKLRRRQMLGRAGKAAGSVVMPPLIHSAILLCAGAAETSLKGFAGVGGVAILSGKTYLRGVTARPAFAYIVSLDTGEWGVLCDKCTLSYTEN
jgi:hypothetical protein